VTGARIAPPRSVVADPLSPIRCRHPSSAIRLSATRFSAIRFSAGAG
jgi:hypothetical protein